MNKDILKQFILLKIYADRPYGTEIMYERIRNSYIMVDGGEIRLDYTDQYLYKYPYEVKDDRQWLESFSKYVSRWFWKVHPLPERHNFFIANIDIDDEYNINILWGSR